ncbi:MAG: amidohydrolase [Ilyomonas sp.]
MKIFFSTLVIFSLMACNSSQKQIDLLVTNGTVYTCDSAFSVQESIAVDKGKIVEAGKTGDLKKKYKAKEEVDAGGQFIFPGLIDAHAHFVSYGLSLQQVNLVGTESWDDVLKRVGEFAKTSKDEWITGNGWDQNDWDESSFPDNRMLNVLFPDRPVILSRIDGHAAIANKKALEMAGIKPGDKLEGGSIEVKDGKLTGILIDNATSLVYDKIPAPSNEKVEAALMDAQRNCFAQGLTTIDDCGLPHEMAMLIDTLQQQGKLKMRMYVMLSDAPANFDWLFRKGKIKTDRLTVRAFKVFADGALGSRGACLIKPYSDKPGWNGFLLSSIQHFDSVANIISQHGFQMCTHAIGDSGNRVMLETYAKYLKGNNDQRWRIEHAQVIDPNDFHFFADYNIIPSVQPTHATSDMYWAENRLGPERIKSAYANKTLLKQNGWIPLGTDFPVEDISPFKTFYAAVFRQDAKGYPRGGFEMDNALSREEAIRGITTWAAKSNFEENEKGSLEAGKNADFVILNTDLMNASADSILKTLVIKTFVGGEKVYDIKNDRL